jgi:hypothetical protein
MAAHRTQTDKMQTDRKARKQDPPAKPGTTRTAKDASGINPDDRRPINPAMPHLPPA